MKVTGIQNKIVVFFVSLLLMTQVITFLMVSATNWNFIQSNVKDQLAVGYRVFERLLQSHSQELMQTVQILADDFAFKTAVITQDQATIESALRNHSSRINAHLSLLISNNNEVLASTMSKEYLDNTESLNQLIQLAKANGKASGIIAFNDELYQVVLVPLMAPLRVGWVCVGFLINDALAADYAKTTALDISFIKNNGEFSLIASTLKANEREDLKAQLQTEGINLNNNGTTPLYFSGKEFRQRTLSLVTNDDISLFAILHRDMQAAHYSMSKLRTQMAGLFFISLLGSLMGTVVLAKGITKPLHSLVEGTKKIAQGGHIEPLALKQSGEIGELVREFNVMQAAIMKREEEIKYRAFYDTLTGLPNRIHFQEQLKQAVQLANKNSYKVAVLVIDLNRFKEINDTLGHNVGDKLLSVVGARIQQELGQAHAIARLGGDEFAVLIEKVTDNEAIDAANLIKNFMAKPFHTEELDLEITVSIGISLYPDHANDPNTMLQLANIAMYVAKEEKRSYKWYDPDFDKHSVFRLSLMTQLKTAVKNDEMVLHYQPKIDLQTREVTHAEALVRWIHPKHGLISPINFIPLAEQTGHIRYLTRWALHTAIKQRYEWQSANLPIKIAINISTVDLLDIKLIDEFKTALLQVPIEPNTLVLEVTESAIMSDPEHAIEVLNTLHDMGLELSIDDFGTGYSSMAQLKNLPVKELKIDQSFIKHLNTNLSDQKIVKATIGLGHDMGLKVAAEGIADQNTLELLTQMGCDIAQGHFISPPLSITDLSQWFIHSDFKPK